MHDQLKLTPPQKVTIVESIIEQMVTQIRDGTLVPGDKLPSERQLIDMLQVSRSSVREALQGLAAMELVESRPGEGTFVKEPEPRFGLDMDIDTLSSTLQREMRHHLNQARLVLELGIVSLAADRINQASRAAIMHVLETYEASADEFSAEAHWPTHDKLHLTIAEATGNPFLVRILQTLLDLVPKPLRDKGSLQGGPEKIRQRVSEERNIHQQLCRAIASGDGTGAEKWMRRHADYEERVINNYYGQS
jgi:GntR family transcriptional repressor for pyruvate dehydrogenase complex